LGYETVREYYPTVGWDFKEFSLYNVTKGHEVPATCAAYFSNSVDIETKFTVIRGEDLARLDEMDLKGKLGGSQTRVRIRFTNDMLDTVVDRFGADGEVSYFKYDARHFIVSANIEISDQFYSWICSFRKKATIISPSNVVDGMKKFISDIEARYQYDK